MAHRALQDIIESIRELDFYRRSVFRTDEGPTSPEAEQIKAETTADYLSLIHISEPTRQCCTSRMPSSA